MNTNTRKTISQIPCDLCLLFAIATASANLRAATITVTNIGDNGPGTLRAALASAANGDTINFALPTSAKITLTSGELLVSKSVSILGPGSANLAVDGNYPNTLNRVFHVASSNAVSISGLTISNGRAAGDDYPAGYGGGIFNDHATLTVSNCTITGNLATGAYGGGISSDGAGGNASLYVVNSIVSGNWADSGGGIFSYSAFGNATLAVSNCTVSGNFAGFLGGGIASFGSGGTSVVIVVNTTLNHNRAQRRGGGIGAGIYSGIATLRVENSTLSSNSVYGNLVGIGDGGGGINYINVNSGGTANVEVINCTLAGNSYAYGGSAGDGILNVGGNLKIGGTILEVAPSGQSLFNSSGIITSLGYNLSSDDGGGFLTNATDQINSDSKLGDLQDNGGPTFTHTLLPGSPAIDRGKNFSASATDQRGLPRTFDKAAIANVAGGDGTDIGAVESQSYTVVNRNDSGTGSLRQALADSNSHAGTNTIDFAPSAYGTILLTTGELLVTNKLFLVGPGAKHLAVDGNAASRVFHIASNSVATIANLTITNGVAGDLGRLSRSGGGIYNDHAILVVSNCSLTGNTAANGGGGILNDSFLGGSARLRIVNSTLNGNTSIFGGGVATVGDGGSAEVEIFNCTLSRNSGQAGNNIYQEADNRGIAHLRIFNSTLNNSDNDFVAANIRNREYSFVEIGSTILLNRYGGIENNDFRPGTVSSLGFNLSSDDGSGFLTNATDQINTDPKLGRLQDNGGPTFTHALTCRSRAIDHGKNFSGLATDQRGFARSFDDPAATNISGGDGTDIGAFEAQQPLPVCDNPPVADASATPTLAISGNGTNATVILDGSRSSDPDDDLLHYDWYENDVLLDSGVVGLPVLPVGWHTIQLLVSDGALSATGGVTIEVITAAEAVNRLADTLGSDVPRPQPLLAALNAVIASADRSNPVSAINQLLAFQNKVRAQVEPLDPALAASLIQSGQEVIDALSGGNTNPGGQPHERFTSMTRQTNGHARLQFSADAARTYIVEASTNLVNWQMIGVAAPLADGLLEFEDTQSAGLPSRFYRIVTP